MIYLHTCRELAQKPGQAKHVSLESLESLEDQLGDGQDGSDRCRIRFERPVRERICRTKAAVRNQIAK